MPVKSNVPIRICGSKTRTGCIICKQRHIKCDEQRPVCLRCQKSNRSCKYEPPQPQTNTIDGNLSSTTSLLSKTRNSIELSSLNDYLSPYGPRELAELAAVKKFATYLGKDLAGCFSDDIWCQVFPRVAQHESSIWHAIAAISMLQTSIRYDRNLNASSPEVVEAINQYSKAIRKLNMQLTSRKNEYYKDVVLLCCVLFAIFECLRNHFKSALRHISGGMKLLIEWKKELPGISENACGVYLDQKALTPVLLSLDSQVVQMGAVDFHDFNSLPAVEAERRVDESFANVQAAHVSLTGIFNRLSRWTDRIEPGTRCCSRPKDDWLNVEKRSLNAELAGWNSAFAMSREYFDLGSATILLSIQSTIMQTIFDKEVDGPSEMEWDKYLPRFEEVLMRAETFMALQTNEQHKSEKSFDSHFLKSGRRRCVLTVTMDIVLSLYLISTRCRWSQPRRKALNMLKTCGRREGIWDSALCSKIAETIITLEENGASDDGFVPEHARVWQLECQYGESETAVIRHKKLLPNLDGSYRIETFG